MKNKTSNKTVSKTSGGKKTARKKNGFTPRDVLIHIIAVVFSIALILAALIESDVITLRQIEEFLHVADENIDESDTELLPSQARKLSVSLIDVGQGDSILIRADGTNVLIDSGEYSEFAAVEHFLRENNISSIDLLIITHQHTDHMGGMSQVVKKYDVKRIIMPDAPDELIPASASYEYFLDEVEKKGLHIMPARSGYSYKLSDDTSLTVLAPLPDAAFDDLNDYSVVTRLDHGDISFLFTGDLSEKGEKALIDSGADLDVTVLKAGHHGASTSSSREFLYKVKPSMVLIPVGKDNKYGHPSEDALKRMGRFTDRIYRTDINGNITVYTDGKMLYVRKDKG